MRSGALPSFAITGAQASTHAAQAMHSICSPARMSNRRRADAHARTAVHARPSARAGVVRDDERRAVEEDALKPRVGARRRAEGGAQEREVEEEDQEEDRPRPAEHRSERARAEAPEELRGGDEVPEEVRRDDGGDRRGDREAERPAPAPLPVRSAWA